MAYLDDHKPHRSQFRDPRREKPSGVVVVHTAESIPDTVALDGGSLAVAKFIQVRRDPGSYHDIADSDSYTALIRYDCEAFHDATGSNPHSYGLAAATRADFWPLAPKAWRDGCVFQMARAAAKYAVWIKVHHGIDIPARRIKRPESTARIPGFISHAERDPFRRTDPGEHFPWDQFLELYAKNIGQAPKPTPKPTKEIDLMAVDIIENTSTQQRLIAISADRWVLGTDQSIRGAAEPRPVIARMTGKPWELTVQDMRDRKVLVEDDE